MSLERFGSPSNGASSPAWDWQEARRCCLRVAARYADCPSEAEDIAHDALLRAWRNRGSLGRVEQPSAWLGRITKNEALRRNGRRRPIVGADAQLEPSYDDERLVSAADRSDIQTAMRQLSAHERELVRLRYQADLTHNAIAQLLDQPEGTVKVQLHRARMKLHQALGGP